jgi:hypothetical protein
VLVIGGTAGFFEASTFGTPGEIEDALGFAVNGWVNTLHIVAGALGLLAAGYAARAYSLAAAVLFGALAIWGFALGSDDALLDRFPADEAQNLLHAVLAALGLAAWIADRPRREPKPKKERPPRGQEPDERKGDAEQQRAARKSDDKKTRALDKRDQKKRREERRKRDERRREERRKREEATKAEKAEGPEKPSRSAGESRSPQTEAGDDSAAPGDEPRTPPGRPSRRRRRRPRPPA